MFFLLRLVKRLLCKHQYSVVPQDGFEYHVFRTSGFLLKKCIKCNKRKLVLNLGKDNTKELPPPKSMIGVV